MTEEEILRDRSGLNPLARTPLMRSNDPGVRVDGREMMNPLNFEETFRRKEEAKTKGTRLQKGGWIKGAIKKPGALRAQLGVKSGQKIPTKKLAAAAKAPGKLGQRARLAQTLSKMKKKK